RYADFIKLDVAMPARRPPDDVLRRVEELDREMGLGAELRRCTHPDFITQVVAGSDPERVGRESVERSAPWLKETPRLRWLARALRDSVAERVWAPPPPPAAVVEAVDGGDSSGGGRGSGGVEAMKLLLEDLAHSYQGRRESARRALQSVLASSPPAAAAAGGSGRVAWTPVRGSRGGEGEGGEERVVVLQEEADREQCGWLFCCQSLPAWTQVAPLVVHAVRDSVFYETSADPIRFSLLGLDLISRQQAPPPPRAPPALDEEGVGNGGEEDGAGGSGGGVSRRGVAGQDRWFFTFLLCKLLSGRKMVASNTLQRYPETFDLAARAVNGALRGATVEGLDLFAEGSVWPDKPRTRFPCVEASTGEVKTVLLPPLLLETAIALLSFHRADANLTPELRELQGLMFPSEHPAATLLSPSSSPSAAAASTGPEPAASAQAAAALVGAGAAKMDGLVRDAVGVKLWVRLAQAPSQQMSALAARHIPKMLLPRLLLASGLSQSCVRVTLSRLDSLGEAADNADELYQYLLSPDAQVTWDMGSTQQSTRTVRHNLSRRVRAYLCSHEGITDQQGGGAGTDGGGGGGDGGDGGDGASKKGDGLFVTWLADSPRQAGGGGERGTKKAAAQAAAQEERERKMEGLFLLTEAPPPTRARTRRAPRPSEAREQAGGRRAKSGQKNNKNSGGGESMEVDDDEGTAVAAAAAAAAAIAAAAAAASAAAAAGGASSGRSRSSSRSPMNVDEGGGGVGRRSGLGGTAARRGSLSDEIRRRVFDLLDREEAASSAADDGNKNDSVTETGPKTGDSGSGNNKDEVEAKIGLGRRGNDDGWLRPKEEEEEEEEGMAWLRSSLAE
ncbi:unnamed protein product, partial [Ectocarpus sp. 4 AP-2014]